MTPRATRGYTAKRNSTASPRLGTHARLTGPDRSQGYGPSPRMADSAASPLVIQHLFHLIRNLVQEDLEAGLLEGEVAAARKHHDPGLAVKPTKVVEAELRHSPTILGRMQQHDRWSLVLLGWNSRTCLEERAVPAHRQRATTAARVGEHCMTEARVVRNRRHRGQHADRDPWTRRWPPGELQQWQSQPRYPRGSHDGGSDARPSRVEQAGRNDPLGQSGHCSGVDREGTTHARPDEDKWPLVMLATHEIDEQLLPVAITDAAASTPHPDRSPVTGQIDHRNPSAQATQVCSVGPHRRRVPSRSMDQQHSDRSRRGTHVLDVQVPRTTPVRRIPPPRRGHPPHWCRDEAHERLVPAVRGVKSASPCRWHLRSTLRKRPIHTRNVTGVPGVRD